MLPDDPALVSAVPAPAAFVEEPVVEGPFVDEPVIEEAVVEEPVVEEPVIEDVRPVSSVPEKPDWFVPVSGMPAANSEPANSEPANSERTNSERTNSERTNSERTNSERTENNRTENEPTENELVGGTLHDTDANESGLRESEPDFSKAGLSELYESGWEDSEPDQGALKEGVRDEGALDERTLNGGALNEGVWDDRGETDRSAAEPGADEPAPAEVGDEWPEATVRAGAMTDAASAGPVEPIVAEGILGDEAQAAESVAFEAEIVETEDTAHEPVEQPVEESLEESLEGEIVDAVVIEDDTTETSAIADAESEPPTIADVETPLEAIRPEDATGEGEPAAGRAEPSAEPTADEPDGNEQTADEQTADQPSESRPSERRPSAGEPTAAAATTTEPTTTEPTTTEPTATQLTATQLTATEPATTEPAATEPAATEAAGGAESGEPATDGTAAGVAGSAGSGAPGVRKQNAPVRQRRGEREQTPSRRADPEVVLTTYPWVFEPATLRERIEETDPMWVVIERLTDKLEYAERDAVRARLLSLRAVAERLLDELDAALEDAREAVEHAKRAGELRLTALTQARLAHVLQWRGEHAEADRLYAEAASPELPARLRAEIDELAGRSAFEQGRYLEAVNHFDQALDLRKGADPELVERIELALDTITGLTTDGWGPYPRTREEILGQADPPRPLRDERSLLIGYVGAVPPRYAQAQPFAEGLAWVRPPESPAWELIDQAGELVIDAASGYRAAGPFAEGLAWVSRDDAGGWYAIDGENRVIVPGGFEDAKPFHNGLALVRRGGWGAVDRHGRVVVQPLYHGFATSTLDGGPVDGFTDEGLAVVDGGEQFGVVDRTGQVVVPPVHAALVIHPAAFLISDKYGLWGALTRQGEPLVEMKFTNRADVLDEIDRLRPESRPVI